MSYMEDYYQENKNADAREVLANLMLELGCRENNQHVGSGMGGNPTEFFFLLTHSVIARGVDEGVSFEKIGSNEILFNSCKKPGMGAVRRALKKFLDEKYPNRQTVTQEQLMNPSFLKDLGSDKLEVKLLIQALEHTYELVKWLDLKLEMQNKLNELSSKEENDLAVRFLREMKLPDTYFEDHKDDKRDPMKRMLKRHPIWGARRKAVGERYGKIIAQLLSPEDNEKLQALGAYPAYITLFAFRSVIQIERTVALNLDEVPSCAYLSEINRDIEGSDSDDDNDDDE